MIPNTKYQPRYRLLFFAILLVTLVPAAIFGYDFVRAALGGSNATPVAVWNFDEGVDNTCANGTDDFCDSSGSGNDGADNGTNWATEDKCVSGKCIAFDANTTDNVQVSDAASLQFSGEDFSVSLWVKPTDLSTQSFYGFLTKREDFSTMDWQLYYDTGSDEIRFGAGESAATTLFQNDDVALETNKWQHIAVTKSGTTYTLYVDGFEKASEVSSQTWTDSDDLFIGNFGDGGTDASGFIDEVKIFDSALSADQVKAEYTGGAAVLGQQDTKDFLNDGLVGYWPMDDNVSGDGQTIVDSSGNGNDGSTDDGANDTGMDCTVGGKFGGGCDFDGSDDAVAVTHNDALDPVDELTYATWFNYDSLNGDDILIYANDENNFPYNIKQFHIDSGSSLGFRIYNGSFTNYSASTGTLSADTWYHATVTVKDGEYVRIFLNGNLVQESDLAGTDILKLGTDQLTLGAGLITGSGYVQNFNGTMDDTRIYNRALSPAEVRALYNWAPGPVGYWPLDENTGTSTVYDHSGNGLNGTLAGSMTESDWVPGKFGSALDFDGANDHIAVSDNDLLEGMAALTVGLWVYVPSDWSATSDSNIIIDKCCSTDEHVYAFQAESDGSSNMQFLVRNSSNTNVGVSFIDFNDYLGQWVYLTGTYDGTTILTYINGVYSGNSNSQSGNVDTNGDSLGIGGRASASDAATHFYGKIDEVKIYNYARTQQQIVEDMNGGHPTGGSPIGSQVAYWKFDEVSGDTFYDSVGSSDGSIVNNGPAWTTGKFNSGIEFDATNNYGTLPDPGIDGTDNLTITFWVKPATSALNFSDMISFGNNLFRFERNTSAEDFALFDTGIETNAINCEPCLTDGVWNHVAFTADPSNWYLYVNGVQKVSGTTDGTLNGASSMFLGVRFDDTQKWTGALDEIKIYSSALTQEQILIDMNGGSSIDFGSTVDEKDDIVDGAGDPPIGYWDLNEKQDNTCSGGSNDACDKSGRGFDGNFNGSPSWGRGKYGSGLYFDSTNDYANVTDNDVFSMNETNELTISTWAKLDSSTAAGNQQIISKGAGSNYEWSLTTNASGAFYATIYQSGGGTYMQTGTADSYYSADTWYYLTMATNITTPYLRLYVNGQLISEDTTSSGSYTNGTAAVRFGQREDAAASFIGHLDEVKIFDYVLTPAQVAYEYNKGAPVAWYKFDECSGTVANDASGNGNAGTINIGGSGSYTSTGTCNSGIGTQSWNAGTAGKLNNSLGLDGTNDFIDAGSDLVDSDDDFTFTAWVYTVTGTNDLILDERDSSYNGAYLEVGFVSDGVVAFGVRGGPEAKATGPDIRSAWHHVAGVWDESATTTYLYVDGVLSGSDSDSVGDSEVNDQLGIGVISGGADSGLGSSSYFDGLIDDVRIYNYALSAAQIRKVMQGGKAGSAVHFSN